MTKLSHDDEHNGDAKHNGANDAIKNYKTIYMFLALCSLHAAASRGKSDTVQCLCSLFRKEILRNNIMM